MKCLVISWKPLVGVLGCAGIAGCQGMAKTSAPFPWTNQVVSMVCSEQISSENQRQRTSSNEATNSPIAELTITSVEDDDAAGTTKFADAQESEDVPAPLPLSITKQEGSETGRELSSAQTLQLSDSERKPISLNDLQQLAAAMNPTLHQADALLEQARGNWLQVGLFPNPTIEAQRGANNAPFDMFNVFVTQEFVTARKLQFNRAVASCDVERARWEAEAQRRRVFNDVHVRYIAALGAQRQVAVAEELLMISKEGIRVSEQLFTGEQVSEADVLQARLQQSQTQIVLRNARIHASVTWKQLGNLIGWPDLPSVQLSGELEEDVPNLDLELAWQQLVADHPSIKAARARVAAAQAQVRREEKQPKPNLQLTGGYGRDFFSPQYPMYTLRFAITPPMFNRNQGNIAAALSDLQTARSEVDRLELALRDELTQAFQNYRSTRNQVQTYHDSVLPMSEKNLSLTLKRYDQGEFDFLRVLTARRDFFDAKFKYVKALTELQITAIKIQGLMLTGGLEPVDSHPTPTNRAGQTSSSGR